MKHLQFLLFLIFISNELIAQKPEFSGQLAGWLTVNPQKPFAAQIGSRYIPKISYKKEWEEKYTLEAELSANIYGNAIQWANVSTTLDGNLKPYRTWISFSTKRLELRAGLQKINFGSAVILRPLMWFDKIDPRDPLQMTDGVYALLGRYYFKNNANIWLWGMYGNKNIKGWEYTPTLAHTPEWGGRVQLPIPKGEMGFTYHHRKTEIFNPFGIKYGFPFDEIIENRYAFDTKVDVGVGVWLETSLTHPNHIAAETRFQKQINFGFDYTFSVGNGIGLTSEYILMSASDKAFALDRNISFSAISLTYPVNVFSNISAILYYDFTNKSLYRFANYTFTFDKWSYYIIAFWNPDKFQIYSNLGEASLFSGYGFQLMAVFNH